MTKPISGHFGWVNTPVEDRLAAAKERAAAKPGYYAGGKHGTFDGAPIWRPKWWGELGNDAEYREATKPRTAFKAAYYEGGHRITLDGVPCRVAAVVKDWAPWMKRAISRLPNPEEKRLQSESDLAFQMERKAHREAA